jgi:hypothetical protein
MGIPEGLEKRLGILGSKRISGERAAANVHVDGVAMAD